MKIGVQIDIVMHCHDLCKVNTDSSYYVIIVHVEQIELTLYLSKEDSGIFLSPTFL